MFDVRLNCEWKNFLKDILESDYFAEILSKLEVEYSKNEIYPPKDLIFNSFNLCPLDKLSVVIIGQDPYINPGEANGLAFSVNSGVKVPPSLKNIYKEIENEFSRKTVEDGDLSYLASQGVLLLNSVLTVKRGVSGSHRDIGWERFTDDVIISLSKNKKNLVYILWGNYAKSKCKLIDNNCNFILTSAHPSPFSASGFFGNGYFLKANKYLVEHCRGAISWLK